jgi:phosphatidylserine decarboxylase
MYLSPRDAHHIYSPVGGTIVKTVHIPGALWPVNDWALHSIDALFAVNERVVTFIESQYGLLAVVMIGATNVGKISLGYAPLETNSRPWEKKSLRTIVHAPGVPVACGDKLGTFKMGSSVIVITESNRAPQGLQQCPQSVKYGQALYG